jgi:hypothetical protein
MPKKLGCAKYAGAQITRVNTVLPYNIVFHLPEIVFLLLQVSWQPCFIMIHCHLYTCWHVSRYNSFVSASPMAACSVGTYSTVQGEVSEILLLCRQTITVSVQVVPWLWYGPLHPSIPRTNVRHITPVNSCLPFDHEALLFLGKCVKFGYSFRNPTT